MEFEERVKGAIKAIPRGKVATYAQVAALAGNHRSARQVVRVLHTSSEKDRLPWHRVINSRGRSSLPGELGAIQVALLADEGIRPDRHGIVDLMRHSWNIEPSQNERQNGGRATKTTQR